MSSDERPILLPTSVERLVGAASKVFTRPKAPPVALVGGLAVIARLLDATEQAYRATTDVDLVAETTDPSVLVILGGPDDDRAHHVSIDGTDVDVIATEAISHEDLLEFEDLASVCSSAGIGGPTRPPSRLASSQDPPRPRSWSPLPPPSSSPSPMRSALRVSGGGHPSEVRTCWISSA